MKKIDVRFLDVLISFTSKNWELENKETEKNQANNWFSCTLVFLPLFFCPLPI